MYFLVLLCALMCTHTAYTADHPIAKVETPQECFEQSLVLFQKGCNSSNRDQKIHFLDAAQEKLDSCPPEGPLTSIILYNSGMIALTQALMKTKKSECHAKKATECFTQSSEPVGQYNIGRILHTGMPGVEPAPLEAFKRYYETIEVIPSAYVNICDLQRAYPESFENTLPPPISREKISHANNLSVALYNNAQTQKAAGRTIRALQLLKKIRLSNDRFGAVAALEQGKILIDRNDFFGAALSLRAAFNERDNIPHSFSAQEFARETTLAIGKLTSEWQKKAGEKITDPTFYQKKQNEYNAIESTLLAPAQADYSEMQLLLSTLYATYALVVPERSQEHKEKALQWIRRAAELNHPEGIRRYACELKESPETFDEAIVWLKKGAELQDSQAMRLIGELLVTKDGWNDDVAYWYQQGAEHGCIICRANYLLGSPMDNNNPQKRIVEIRETMKKMKNSSNTLVLNLHKTQQPFFDFRLRKYVALSIQQKCTEAGISEDDNSADYHLIAAKEWKSAEYSAETHRHLFRALVADPSQEEAANELVAYYKQSGRSKECIQEIENGIKLLEEKIDSISSEDLKSAYKIRRKTFYRYLGNYLFEYAVEQCNTENKYADKEKIHQLNEQSLDAYRQAEEEITAKMYHSFAMIEKSTENHPCEETYLVQSFIKDQQAVHTQVALGNCYFNQDKFSQAKGCYDRALAQDPDNLDANLALAFMEMRGYGFVPNYDNVRLKLPKIIDGYQQKLEQVSDDNKETKKRIQNQIDCANDLLLGATMSNKVYINTVKKEQFIHDYINLYRIRRESAASAISLAKMYEQIGKSSQTRRVEFFGFIHEAQQQIDQNPSLNIEIDPSERIQVTTADYFGRMALFYYAIATDMNDTEGLYHVCRFHREYPTLQYTFPKKQQLKRLAEKAKKVNQQNPFDYYLAAAYELLADEYTGEVAQKTLDTAADFGDGNTPIVVPAACYRVAEQLVDKKDGKRALYFLKKAAPYDITACNTIAFSHMKKLNFESKLPERIKLIEEAIKYDNMAEELERKQCAGLVTIEARKSYLKQRQEDMKDDTLTWDDCLKEMEDTMQHDENNPDSPFSYAYAKLSGRGSKSPENRHGIAKDYFNQSRALYAKKQDKNAKVAEHYAALVPYHDDLFYAGKTVSDIFAEKKEIIDLFDGISDPARKHLLLGIWRTNLIYHLPASLHEDQYKRLYDDLYKAHQIGNEQATIRLVDLYLDGTGYVMERNLPLEQKDMYLRESCETGLKILEEHTSQLANTIWEEQAQDRIECVHDFYAEESKIIKNRATS